VARKKGGVHVQSLVNAPAQREGRDEKREGSLWGNGVEISHELRRGLRAQKNTKGGFIPVNHLNGIF